MKNKAQFFFANVKSINVDEKTIDVIASTPDKDRDGDIILPSAFKKNLKSFKSNPVILACHQHRLQSGSSPVIGSAISESITISDKELGFTMRFAETKLGDEYWVLYRDKHMRAFSVGFIAEKWEDSRDSNGRFTHRTYTQVELLEVSAVPVPSNRQALARAKGYFDDEDTKDNLDEQIKEVIDLAKAIINFKDHIDEVLDGIDDIKSLLLETDPEKFAKGLLGAPEDTNLPAGDQKSAERISDILNSF